MPISRRVKKGRADEDGERQSRHDASRPRIVERKDAPEWMHAQFIERGYRVHYNSVQSLLSIFTLHNETFNVWTHFLALAFFLYCQVNLFYDEFWQQQSVADQLVMHLGLLCASLCFLLSGLFHALLMVSSKHFTFWLSLDLSGIVIQSCASFLCPIFFAFACAPTARTVYLAFYLSMSCLFVFLAKTAPWFVSIRERAFVSLVVSTLVPLFHWIHISGGLSSQEVQLQLPRILITYGLYAFGFVFFLSHIPERFFPRLFDICGQSHQIWHTFVFGAAYWSCWSLDEYFRFRQRNRLDQC